MRRMYLVFIAVTPIGVFTGIVLAVQGNMLGAGIMWAAAILYATIAIRVARARARNSNDKDDKR